MPGAASSSRPALRALVPYEPGKPVEELQRELGLERVVKLASNEGMFGPFPAALEAIERCARELNRYPDGGAYRLRRRTCRAPRSPLRRGRARLRSGRRHGLPLPGIARSGRRDRVRLAIVLELSHRCAEDGRQAEARAAAGPPLRPRGDRRAAGPRTKIVYLCHPNNPTGTANDRSELDTYFDAVPGPRPDRHRPGVFRVRRGLRRTAMPSRRTSRRAQCPRACERSRRSTGWPGFGSVTA